MKLDIESTKDDTAWYNWMMSADQMKKGHIRFYKTDSFSKLFDFEFWDAHCVALVGSFDDMNGVPMKLTVTLSPGIFKIRDVVFEKPWKVSDPFSGGRAIENTIQEVKKEEEDFEITFSLNKNKTVVPYGIIDFEGNFENPYFSFNYTLKGSDIDVLYFSISDESGNAIYTLAEMKSVIIEGATTKMPFMEPQKEKPFKFWDYQDYKDSTALIASDYTKEGVFMLFWDGFDSSEIYDSARFANKKLTAKITAVKGSKQKSLEVELKTEYKEVNWVDVKIDRNAKRIDATLRVNLRDGGANGLDCRVMVTPNQDFPISETICPWDDIPKETLESIGKPIIKERTKSFEELKKLALEGIDKYWSRTFERTQGKGSDINGEKWEILVKSVHDDHGMVAPRLIYFTNSENATFNRSHNWEVSRELYYKEGYVKSNNSWDYIETTDSNEVFLETAAHEIGHQLLLEYGGHNYSKSHKGTSHWSLIIQNPISGTTYPETGEIDLMKYAEYTSTDNYIKRVVISQEDLLGLIWLTKINIK